MAVAEEIHEKIKLLPRPAQYAVLDFVEYLLYRSRQEDLFWSRLSLRWALRDLEDEETGCFPVEADPSSSRGP